MFDKLERRRATKLGDLSLQLSDARLAGITVDQSRDGPVRYPELTGGQVMRIALLWHEMPLRDLDLFFDGVAGDLDDLHAVEERMIDGIRRIGCRDEQHV